MTPIEKCGLTHRELVALANMLKSIEAIEVDPDDDTVIIDTLVLRLRTGDRVRVDTQDGEWCVVELIDPPDTEATYSVRR